MKFVQVNPVVAGKVKLPPETVRLLQVVNGNDKVPLVVIVPEVAVKVPLLVKVFPVTVKEPPFAIVIVPAFAIVPAVKAPVAPEPVPNVIVPLVTVNALLTVTEVPSATVVVPPLMVKL